MGDRELPQDRVASVHGGIEPFLDGPLAREDVLQREFDGGIPNLDVVAEAQALAVRRGLGVLQLAHGRPLLGVALVATIFWNSAMTKLANWETAVTLFAEEYKLPLLPPEVAAYLAVSIELTTPVLLVLGLLTRPAALVLLGMTTVIEIFVYPQAWPTHIQWAAMLLGLALPRPGQAFARSSAAQSIRRSARRGVRNQPFERR